MRAIILSFTVLGLMSAPAFAEPKSNFPTKEEMHKAIDKMPDFNALFDDLIRLSENSKVPERMERSAQKLKTDLEESGALEPDRNGLPDIKLTLKIITAALADEDISESLHDTLTDFEAIMEKHLPEDDRNE